MATLLISYDLKEAPRDEYESLFDAIKKLDPVWWHCLESTWIINTSYTVVQVRDWLAKHIHSGDELLVINVTKPAAWQFDAPDCRTWLLTRLQD